MFLKRKTSLTSRMTVAYSVSFIGLLLIVTVYLYWSLSHALEYRDEKFFKFRFGVLHSLTINHQIDDLRLRIEKEWPPRTSEVFFVRVLKNDRLISQSHGGEWIFKAFGRKKFSTLRASSQLSSKLVPLRDRVFRILISNWDVGNDKYSAIIALDRTEESLLLDEYRNRLIFVLFIGFVGSMLICLQVARRGLRPIQEMEKTAARINSSNLDERMHPAEMPDELARLGKTFNAMLDRLRTYFDQLQRFSADIAHELRTPINNISGELQVTLGKERDSEYYKNSIGSCLEECGRICHIIDSLLFLAHAENPQIELSREKINLRKELAITLEFYEPAASEKGITCSLAVDPQLTLNVERILFQRAIGNLLSNAIKNTPSPGKIVISAAKKDEQIEIAISDSGVGISSEHVPFIFDRFYRVDASRSTGSGGSGLGLAIVKSIASIHGGEVGIESSLQTGTRVRLSFPGQSTSSTDS